MTDANTSFWKGRRVFLTGHTGFKGAWLRLWLLQLGAEVDAVALAPATSINLHEILAGKATSDDLLDIRHAAALAFRLRQAEPEVVFHLAAQPLVRASYRNPKETFDTNVMGTINLMDAIREAPSVKAAVIVTTDKVYENHGEGRPFSEGDRLGGHDPYSNSKACAELAVQCYRDSFFQRPGAPVIATARAGNVIGGGDWSEDRLVPDMVRAMLEKRQVELRYPRSIRPWQHVLDPLHGYLALAERLVSAPTVTPKAINFGPDPEGFVTVSDVVDLMSPILGGAGWRQAAGEHPVEASVLTLATDLAKQRLGWEPVLGINDTIRWTAEWYRAWTDGADMKAFTLQQISDYRERAASL